MAEQLISFPRTEFDKTFAKIWLGGVGAVFIFGLFAEGVATYGLVVCGLMLVLGTYYFNKTVWSLADEVWDCGDHLKIIIGNHTQKIYFTDIVAVNLTYPNHKYLITVKTKTSGPFSKSVTFRAVRGYPFFRAPKILSQLKQRAGNA